jgi:Tat protein secretion system quality control protein TatD with DNase activity
VGLDYPKVKQFPKSTPALQKQILAIFLDEAEKQDKILNLHVRGASEDAFAMLSTYNLKRVILHGHRDSVETFREGVERGTTSP